MAKLYVILVFVLVVVHATARNIPTDQTKPSDHTTTDHEVKNPNTNALAPVQNTENVATTAASPAANGGLDDQKNFIYGGVGGWGGVGGFVGVLPIFGLGGLGGGSGLGGVGGLGAGGGIGKVGGNRGCGGIGKVGGIGVGGGVGVFALNLAMVFIKG
ncbi:hypothetical protein Salat_2120200 [Sesamum alatum]|uniref:Glycine-rich protein n=1 Tax=Sesamum alatum TaxID=300844 RepID=A0AAE1Y1T7_9LAMI|nr:hypothetical protein Salat_2120200 [Sesamum alatum]